MTQNTLEFCTPFDSTGCIFHSMVNLINLLTWSAQPRFTKVSKHWKQSSLFRKKSFSSFLRLRFEHIFCQFPSLNQQGATVDVPKILTCGCALAARPENLSDHSTLCVLSFQTFHLVRFLVSSLPTWNDVFLNRGCCNEMWVLATACTVESIRPIYSFLFPPEAQLDFKLCAKPLS